MAFVNQRYLPFGIGIFLLVLMFLVDRYRQRGAAAASPWDANIALKESKRRSNWNQLKKGFASTFITSARGVLTPAKSLVFSGLLLAALPLWNVSFFMATVVALCCLLLAYGSWWSSRVNSVAMLGRVLAGTVTACILAAGVVDLWAVHSSSSMPPTAWRRSGKAERYIARHAAGRPNIITGKKPDINPPALGSPAKKRFRSPVAP